MTGELQLDPLEAGVKVLAEAGSVSIELVTEAGFESDVRYESPLEPVDVDTVVTPGPDLAVYMDETAFSGVSESRVVLLTPDKASPTQASDNVLSLSSHARTAHAAELAASRRAA